MTEFDVLPDELRLCASVLAEITQETRTELETLTDEMNGLLGSGWQGGAADGFGQGWRQWQHGAQEVLQALTELSRLVDTAGQGYAAADVDVAGTYQQSGAAL